MKKKTIKTASILALSAVLAVGFTACNAPKGTENGDTVSLSEQAASYATPSVSTHDNKGYNEYLLGTGNSEIDNQWAGYGIGDPFVMRFNGKYYLYVSSLDTEKGVRGYVSDDLVNWTPMTGTGLKTGFVSEDQVTLAAYAPEVYYFNGTFYMYTSPAGNGHYILTAQNPEGPFVKATNNFGLAIDGSVFIDDDETMYFQYASNDGIRMAPMADMLTATGAGKIDGANLGGWTEGSYLMKRDGIYYLTYTGNHVASDGYRIAYSTATELGEYYDSNFTKQQNNPIALETETALKGIGHSSTVMGPDMDSYYLVYHYLNSSGGPNRSLGIDRLTFNGTMMSVAPKLEKSVKPALPEFTATGTDGDKFETSGDFLVSKTSAPANFTAEYNVTGSGVTTYVFGYTDANNYFDVTVDLSAKSVKLNKTVGGTASEVAAGTLKNDFASDKLHTVRVASRDGKVDVVFDNMTKIDNAQLTVSAGKIGYKSLDAGATVGYTAYSNVAMGMSDEREAKQITGYTGANNYLRDTQYTQAPVLGTGSGLTAITEEDDEMFAGWNKLTLGNTGDSVSYLLYNGTAGRYGLELIYPASCAGNKIGVKVDGVNGGKVYRCTLPEVDGYEDEEMVKAVVGEFDLAEGARIVRLENVGSKVSFAAFRFIEASNVTPVFENALSSYVLRGAKYETIWKIKEDADGNVLGHYAKAGTRQYVSFGDNTITDFTLEVEMMLEGATASSTAGIVFRAQNYASSPHDRYTSMQGYYLSLKNEGWRLEYLDYDNSYTVDFYNPHYDSDTWYKIKIQARGNKITVWIGEEEVYSGEENWVFAGGKIGLYTDGAAAVYRNLKISY